jgi:large subunit ribosomal protein L3
MPAMLMGTKLGMTRVFNDAGVNIPVTVIEVGPCVVTQVKTKETDGYTAVQVAYGAMKARNATIPMIGHDMKAGSEPKRYHREFLVSEDEAAQYTVGQQLDLDAFEATRFVDVVGTSKGKGYQGTMKRHGYKGQLASHGVERKHRSPGSIGGHANERGGTGGPKRGKKMSGQMGNVRVTMRSLDVVRIDKERNLLLVKGPVPGSNKGMVMVRPAVRLYKSKAAKAAAAG